MAESSPIELSSVRQDTVSPVSADSEEVLARQLVERSLIRATDLDRMVRVRQGQDIPDSIARLGISLGLVSEYDMAATLADLLELPIARDADYPEFPVGDATLSARFLKQCLAVPIRNDGDNLVLAMADPRDEFAVSALELACQQSVMRCLGLPSQIEAAIERLYGSGRTRMGQILADVTVDEATPEFDLEHLRDLASEAPVIRLVSLVMRNAADAGASDIHIEPFEDRLRVRYRVDGILRDAESPPAHLTAAVISRIKIMANLNIAERRLPQDGRIRMRTEGKELDVRVSAVPTVHGESVVLRLLNRDNVALDFEPLGFAAANLEKLNSALSLPHGMVVVTGPTGSGKTTTLYAALNKLNTTNIKMITVEDPVEYQLEGLNQIQVNQDVGLTFSSALRAIVRQDPDVIMVGEMRDLETARICVQSALTGHLVLSTLHTNDAAGAITRLIEMGVEEFLLTSTLNAVLAQRLVRVLCPECKESYAATPEIVQSLDIPREESMDPIRLYRPIGCAQCSGSGYKGRTAIIEVIVMTDSIRRQVLKRADATEILQQARREGMTTMYRDGVYKALAGITSIEEVMRVTYDE